jgi:hypothetical protein
MDELAEIECSVFKIHCDPKTIAIGEDESNAEYSGVVGIILVCFHFRQ